MSDQGNVVPFSGVRQEREELKHLDSGGGGDDSGGMEGRLTALEADTRDIKSTLGRLEPVLARVDERVRKVDADGIKTDERLRKIETDLAELKGRVSQLPSTVQLIGFVLAVLLFSGAIKYFLG